MYIELPFLIAVILHIVSAAFAISLINRTRYNFSWMLVTVGFLLMASRRLYEYIELLRLNKEIGIGMVSSWMALLISVLMFVGVFYVRKLFRIQDRIDSLRKLNEAKVLSAIIHTEEKSRREFSKELHDGLGPLLSAIKMSVSAIDKSETNEANLDIINNAEKNIDEAITAIKEISNNLSPHMLKNFGLHKAAEAFAEHFTNTEMPDIRLSSNIEGKRFDYNIEIILYRIICELVANTIKHAAATLININLFHRKNEIELIYTDNGTGFDVENIENSSGMGLSNIRSRIRSLNGSIEIFSKPGEGFNVKIIVAV